MTDKIGAIVINLDILDNGGSPDSKNKKNPVHPEAFLKILNLLSSKPPKDEGDRAGFDLSFENQVYTRPRRHEAIFLSARRGDGKTSFLNDLNDAFGATGSEYHELLGHEFKSHAASLWCLGVIDPTLVEIKQNIVIIVIDAIRSAVEDFYDSKPRASRGEYDDIKSALVALAEGLPLLDGVGDDDHYGRDWADPDYVLEKGLDRARAASRFATLFHKYIAMACRFLARDAFVLLLDDVDTYFSRGWPVLESVRKYFSSPHLKLVIAGDLKLYNIAVRRQQWDQIGKSFFDTEKLLPEHSSYADQISNMVDILQDQYLIKIAQPQYRVELRPIIHYIESGQKVFFESARGPSKSNIPVTVFSDRLSRHLFALSPRDYGPVRSLLLRLPLRSALQVARGSWDLVTVSGINHSRGIELANAREQALESLRHVASAAIMTLDLDESEIRDPDPARVFLRLGDWMTRKGFWRSMSRFYPQGLNEAHDLTALVISSMLATLFGRLPGSIVDYWIQICTIREMIDRSFVTVERESRDRPSQLVQLQTHLGSLGGEQSIQFASRFASWDFADKRRAERGVRFSGISVPVKQYAHEPAAKELYGYDGHDGSYSNWILNTYLKKAGYENEIPEMLLEYVSAAHSAEWTTISSNKSNTDNQQNGAVNKLFYGIYINSLTSLKTRLSEPARTIALLPACIVTSNGAQNGVYSFNRLLGFIGEVMSLGGIPAWLQIPDREPVITPASEAAAHTTSGNITKEITSLLAKYGDFWIYPIPGAISETNIDHDEFDSEADDNVTPENTEIDREINTLSKSLTEWALAYNKLDGFALSPLTAARIWTRFNYACETYYGELAPHRTRYLGTIFNHTIVIFLHAVAIECLVADSTPVNARHLNNPTKTVFTFSYLLDSFLKDEPIDSKHWSFFRWMFACPLWGYYFCTDNSVKSQTEEKSSDSNDNIRKHFGWMDAINEKYRENSSQFANNKIDATRFKVKFDSPRNKPAIELSSLHAVLNTIQTLGHRPSPAATNRQAKHQGGKVR